ncbi:mannitol dehydrogenase family protein [Paraburkholderia sp. MMS20-SJTR3]|uniref:Mannitol dehydrogenase family protein n=1 Tax=Paraburkholderia sejongensis TaxID=2886946 RepID=A0ABS8K180_9BURK|nr:mannitol dehydrogenase family protein [Paraburkholderia sp. MMS20-SJTR3]MCC8395907.1 mannitol dehydrogenase family protein [Paraburkholderia sp. MMS20-SJTR3]
MSNPILQFGTSRFLQAHADLFVSEALDEGRALGHVTVVQTTANPDSLARIDALRARREYDVRIRGVRHGAVIDTTTRCHAINEALNANTDWPAVVERFANDARVVISNTGDRGYEGFAEDTAELLRNASSVPRGFVAKLVVLLHARFHAGAAPLTLLPCELVSHNGDTLRGLVADLARAWGAEPELIRYIEHGCVWVNSLVDRIVSEPIVPVGAVAEPYALWAIERRAEMVLPCEHAAIIVTDDLPHYERLKLLLLNLGHTWLAERWQVDARDPHENTLHAMRDPALRADLESLWRDEVLPIFDALGQGSDARAYLDEVRERFENPFLDHRLADIARNHEQKKLRRFGPVIELARELGVRVEQPRLRAALGASPASS